MYPLLNQKVGVEYLEKPVTRDEKSIADILEKIVTAFSVKNVPLLASVLSDNALVMMPNDKSHFFNKTEYIKAAPKIISKVRKVSYSNALIRVVGNDNALISCIGRTFLQNRSAPTIQQRYFKCEKQNGEWLITESGFC